MLLDEVMPHWDRRSTHRVPAEFPPPVVFASVEGLTWREVPVFRALVALRGFGLGVPVADATVLHWFATNGFRQVGRTDNELVVVAAQPFRHGAEGRIPTSTDSFREFGETGYLKIATNFLIRDGFLITETRILATDVRARRQFSMYWAVIRPGSGLIRRVWLSAIRTRARSAIGQ